MADFGAGAGAAGLAVLSRCAGAEAVLVEQAEEMAAFADTTLGHPGNAHLGDRASVLRADVTLSGSERRNAGLADRSFDFVVMNPPFNAVEDRATPDTLRRQAHVAEEGLFENWLRSAAAVLKPTGGVALIARPEQLRKILDALDGRFGSAEMIAVQPRPQAAAIRIVIRAWRGARGKFSVLPPLVMHEGAGNGFSARADLVCNGLAPLFGDG
ncbi:MAG: methyltransferase [Mesorhizobium sp.]